MSNICGLDHSLKEVFYTAFYTSPIANKIAILEEEFDFYSEDQKMLKSCIPIITDFPFILAQLMTNMVQLNDIFIQYIEYKLYSYNICFEVSNVTPVS